MQASLQHKTHGQAIPLIAAMLVVLFGMVALAVDVGQTYAEQRNIVRGTNAAALAGMSRYLNGGTDGDILKAIEQSLIANGVRVTTSGQTPQPGDRTVTAQYLDAAGKLIASCPQVGACSNQKVDGVKYIRVDVGGKVQMYFARLFGTNELPVASNAFSKLGFCTSGFYPIGVRTVVNGQTVVNDKGFATYDGFYTDETYNDPPLAYKRVYLHGITNSNGGFSFLRWDKDKQASGNTGALASMLAGDGNIGQSFTEVKPWPNISEGPAEYTGYPRQPGEFSGSEWVYGSDFNSNNSPFTNDVKAQLDYHKKNRTLLKLPLYRYDNGNVDNPAYYVDTVAEFLLTEYGVDPTNGAYLTLAYVRQGGMCASLETNPPPADKMVLSGTVAYLPRYRVPNDADRPIRFMVVLDVTGSMNWNFSGGGTINGANVNCVDGQQTCNTSPNTGPKAAWGTIPERRIYIAKQVLKDFVDEMASQANVRPYDKMQLVTFAGDFGDLVNNTGDPGNNAAAVTDLTDVYPATWSNNSAVLKGAIDQAGDIGQGPYLMDGATSSAAGLARATQEFDKLPKPDRSADGQLYRNVVIFVTDGVANVMRNGLLNNFNNCAAETVACQAGLIEIGGQQLRAPLEAMVYEANNLTQEHVIPTGGATYVVALGSNTDKTGLDAVATSGLAKKANDPNALKDIFADLQQDAIYGDCKEGFAPSPVNTMAASNVATGSPPNGFTELTTSKVGEVFLTNDETKQTFIVPIVASEPGRVLSYEARDLPRGQYTMKAWVGYRAPEDKTAHSYDQFMSGSLPSSEISVSVTSSGASINGEVEKNISLDMSKLICATEN